MYQEEIEYQDQLEIKANSDGERIDSWLVSNIEGHTRSYFQKLIDDGLVQVNGKAVRANHKIKAGEIVTVDIPLPESLDIIPQDIPLDIIYEDNDIIVINKARGMVVHPAAGNYEGTLVNALMYYCKDTLSDINGVVRPGIVHRIDKDTTGLLVVAKNNQAHIQLSQKLKNHEIKRTYLALVEGVIKENSGKIDAPIGRHPTDRKKMAVELKNGKPAVTYFTVLKRYASTTLVECKLMTGRTHQIRVHMTYIGYPVVGDQLYGRKNNRGIDGQALHAIRLELVHPVTGESMCFEAPLPYDFKDLLDRMEV